MEKTRLHNRKQLLKLYAYKIKLFPLERSKRSLIYDNPKILECRNVNMQEWEEHTTINVETLNERDKNHRT